MDAKKKETIPVPIFDGKLSKAQVARPEIIDISVGTRKKNFG